VQLSAAALALPGQHSSISPAPGWALRGGFQGFVHVLGHDAAEPGGVPKPGCRSASQYLGSQESRKL